MQALEQFDVLMPTLGKLVAETDPSELDIQTPCTEWKVRDLFGHLYGGATTFAAVVAGEEPPADVTPPPDDELPGAVVRAATAIDAAFRQPGALERVVATPFGEMPAEVFARVLAFDLLMHTWDLATATGRPVDVPEDVVAEIDAFARQAVQPEMRVPGIFGPEVEPPAGASTLERLVAFSGRCA
jgi:uncharacterized protein (TIGR03086 family)